LGRADVDPVAPIDVRDERLAPLDERRKEAPLDGPGHVLRNAVERFGLEDVDAGVDRVARDLVGVRLLEKPHDVAVRIRFDEPVRARVLDRRQNDRRFCLTLPMQLYYGTKVYLREHVAVEDDDRVVQRLAGVADGATGA